MQELGKFGPLIKNLIYKHFCAEIVLEVFNKYTEDSQSLPSEEISILNEYKDRLNLGLVFYIAGLITEIYAFVNRSKISDKLVNAFGQEITEADQKLIE